VRDARDVPGAPERRYDVDRIDLGSAQCRRADPLHADDKPAWMDGDTEHSDAPAAPSDYAPALRPRERRACRRDLSDAVFAFVRGRTEHELRSSNGDGEVHEGEQRERERWNQRDLERPKSPPVLFGHLRPHAATRDEEAAVRLVERRVAAQTTRVGHDHPEQRGGGQHHRRREDRESRLHGGHRTERRAFRR
jgi:hypothetical protein